MKEVKRQGENALVVTAREFGKMGCERLAATRFSVTSVEIVAIGSVNRQSYQ